MLLTSGGIDLTTKSLRPDYRENFPVLTSDVDNKKIDFLRIMSIEIVAGKMEFVSLSLNKLPKFWGSTLVDPFLFPRLPNTW